MPFHRGQLGRLVVAHVEAVHVAEDELERRQPDDDADGHADHDAAVVGAPPASRYQAPMPPTTNAVVRNAAATICVNR